MSKRQRRRLKAALGRPSNGYNSGRGRDYFLISLLVLPIMVAVSAVAGASVSPSGAFAFVIGFSVLAGIVGTSWITSGSNCLWANIRFSTKIRGSACWAAARKRTGRLRPIVGL